MSGKSNEKNHFAFAILCPLAATAHAQSSVTFYGLIDEGFEAESNVAVAGHQQCSQISEPEFFGLNVRRRV